MTPVKDLTLRIGGEGGEGVISAAEIISRAAARSGLEIFTFRTYPAEIRGGLAMMQIRLGTRPVLSQGTLLDVLMAFNEEAVRAFVSALRPDGVLFYDTDTVTPSPGLTQRAVPAGLNNASKNATGSARGKNIVAVGFLSHFLGLSPDVVRTVVKETFAKKGQEIVASNLKALEAGLSLAGEAVTPLAWDRPGDKGERLVLSGNEAVSLGAIAAGLQFCAGYPITPASPILELLSRELTRYGGVVVQCEDEIAALGACLGASYAGKKAMTPTSGPGISLMSEMINLASMIELPVVVVDVQRGGPSTGLPTKTEQSDLAFAVFGTSGESPRAVVAPADVEDCFSQTVRAFNIAEKYQMPVIILSDQSLAYRTQTIRPPRPETLEVIGRTMAARTDNDGKGVFRRYEMTETGVSPFVAPGTEGLFYVASGLEHDERGTPNYTPEYHRKMTEKRFRKLRALAGDKKLASHTRVLSEGARIGIIGWGSTEGAIAEAAMRAEDQGLPVARFHPRLLYPLPERDIAGFIDSLDKVMVVEENYTGQLSQILKARFGLRPVELLKAEGIPFTSDEVYNKLKEIA